MCESHSVDGAVDRRALFRAGAGVLALGAVTVVEPAVAADDGKVKTLVFEGEFTDPTTPDWHYLPFTVPRGVRKIHVSYEYSPTDLGPISFNVVDIGIFDPSGHGLGDAQGFRGWSGGARSEFRITRWDATPGYLAGPITPGRWHLLLGPYQITGPGTPYTVVVRMHLGPKGRTFVPDPAPQAVPGTGPGWYRGDLHVHTVHSDGARTQPQTIRAAQAAGLDFVGSADHNTSSATYVWGRHVPDDFLVINGEEVTTRSGHWLAMGLPPQTWIDWRYRAGDDKLGRFTERVHELGGIAIAAHPNNPVSSIRWDHGYAGIDAIEAWNGPWTGDDQKTVTNWHADLVGGTYLPIVGNSDTHNDSQPIGQAQSVYRLGDLSAAEVVAAIKGGHLWIAESSAVQLEFTASVAGRPPAECGDQLTAAAEDTVAVRLAASGIPGAFAVLWGASGPLGFAVADAAGELVLEQDVPGAERFVRAEIGRPDDAVVSPVEDTPIEQMVALTNPIFLT